MRIKEVIALTGLTDKTIRYYISKGLVFPNNNVSYSGCSNYNFTDDDVKTLNRIAVLRKAGFSVSQIDLIKKGTNTKEEITSLLEKKEAEITLDEIVIEVLKEYNKTDNPDFCSLSDALESKMNEVELVEEKEIGRAANIAAIIIISI
ncbi:MAG: MerR family transcriptional regulator [Clostridia bacterium]|nr:MerR family transcriptional regulator [Clostridia bacterium]